MPSISHALAFCKHFQSNSTAIITKSVAIEVLTGRWPKKKSKKRITEIHQDNLNDQPPGQSQCFPGALNPAFCQKHTWTSTERRGTQVFANHATPKFSPMNIRLACTAIDKHANPPLSLILRPSRTVRETARFMGHLLDSVFWEGYRGLFDVIRRSFSNNYHQD